MSGLSYQEAVFTPSEITQAKLFIDESVEKRNDGRGIIIAVLDTGVDPSASGLQVCADGRPKIVDLVEATGSGDCQCSTAAVAKDGVVTGLTGRALRLNPSWRNPSGKWLLGAKKAFECMAKPLKSRVASTMSSDAASLINEKIAAAAAEVAALKAATSPAASPEAIEDAEAKLDLLKKSGLSTLGWSEVIENGPLCDVIAWHDGDNNWRACIDTRCDGDLSAAPAMASFRKEQQWQFWGKRHAHAGSDGADGKARAKPKTLAEIVALAAEETLLAYSINVYPESHSSVVVSIVTDAGSHGTHVAGICAAYHPSHSAFNGVAPSAQIVSIKIGDTRIGSMETSVGLTRALRAILDNGCQVINMSYGEPTGTGVNPALMGRWNELAAYLVREHNVVFVSSAGNAGPALSTNGAPGATNPYILGIGAAVDTQMQSHLYHLRTKYSGGGRTGTGAPRTEAAIANAAEAVVPDAETDEQKHAVPTSASLSPSPSPAAAPASAAATHDPGTAGGLNYTWTSRGPGIDGSLPVCVSAPGGAIASIPSWNLAKYQLMNGTSMASPSAAGCISLILSALKNDGLPLPPVTMLRRALEATAVPLSGTKADSFGAGAGMIQVKAAHAHLLLQYAVKRGVQNAVKKGDLSAFPVSPSPTPAGAGAGAGANNSSVTVADTASAVEDYSLDPFLDVTVANGGVSPGDASDRGVYLRNPEQSATAADFTVTVKPVWRESTTPEAKTAYQTLFALRAKVRHYSVPSYSNTAAAGGGGGAFKLRRFFDDTSSACVDAAVDAVTGVAAAAASADGSKDDETAGGAARGSFKARRRGSAGAGNRGVVRIRHGHSPAPHHRETTSETAAPSAEAAVHHAASRSSSIAATGGLDPRSIISFPQNLLVMNGGRSFNLHVDPTNDELLPPGSLLCIELCGYAILQPAVLAAAKEAVRASSGWAAVQGLDVANESFFDVLPLEVGPAFRVPITIVKPLKSAAGSDGDGGEDAAATAATCWSSGPIALAPGVITRHFLAVPTGATWAEFSVARSDSDAGDVAGRTINLHVMSSLRNVSGKFSVLADEYFPLKPGDVDTVSASVPAGSTIEVAVAQFWSSLGATRVSVTVKWHGVTVSSSGQPLSLSAFEGPVPVTVSCNLSPAMLRPVGLLTSARTYIPPLSASTGVLSEQSYLFKAWAAYSANLLHGLPSLKQVGQVVPLPMVVTEEDAGSSSGSSNSRDLLVTGKAQYALTLAYSLPLACAVSGARLSSGFAHGQLYEGPFDSVMIVVVDSKQPAFASLLPSPSSAASTALAFPSVVGVSDAFPESLDLPAGGDFVAFFQLRHSDPKALERFAVGAAALSACSFLALDVPIGAAGKDSTVALKVFSSLPDACADRAAISTGKATRRIQRGATARYFLCAPGAEAATHTGVSLAANTTGAGKAASFQKDQKDQKVALPRDELHGFLQFEDCLPSSLSSHRQASFLHERAGIGRFHAGSTSHIKGGDMRSDPLRFFGRDPSGVPVTVRVSSTYALLGGTSLAASASSSASSSSSGSAAVGGTASVTLASLHESYKNSLLATLKTLNPWPSSPSASLSSTEGSTDASSVSNVDFAKLRDELLADGGAASAIFTLGSSSSSSASSQSLLALFSKPDVDEATAKKQAFRLKVLQTTLHTLDDSLSLSLSQGKKAIGLDLEHATIAARKTEEGQEGEDARKKAAAVIQAAADLISFIDQKEVAAYHGVAHDLAAEDKEKKENSNNSLSFFGLPNAKALQEAMNGAREALADAAWRALRLHLTHVGKAAAAALAAASSPAASGNEAGPLSLALSRASALRLFTASVSSYKSDGRYKLVELDTALEKRQHAVALRALNGLPSSSPAVLAPEVAAGIQSYLLDQLAL